MSIHANHAKSSRFCTWLIAASAVVLVGTEVIGIAAATAWAVGGLFQFSSLLTWVLGTVLCMGAGWVTLVFARSAWRFETGVLADPQANSNPHD